MDKQLKVYYFQISHWISIPSHAQWEALGLTIQVVCLGGKRGCNPGLGCVRSLAEGVIGNNGRVEWQLDGWHWGML